MLGNENHWMNCELCGMWIIPQKQTNKKFKKEGEAWGKVGIPKTGLPRWRCILNVFTCKSFTVSTHTVHWLCTSLWRQCRKLTSEAFPECEVGFNPLQRLCLNEYYLPKHRLSSQKQGVIGNSNSRCNLWPHGSHFLFFFSIFPSSVVTSYSIFVFSLSLFCLPYFS